MCQAVSHYLSWFTPYSNCIFNIFECKKFTAENLNITYVCVCHIVLLIIYQIFDCVWAIIPLWRCELVVSCQYHTQHQHLFPVPEWRRSSQQCVHDHTSTPAVETTAQFRLVSFLYPRGTRDQNKLWNIKKKGSYINCRTQYHNFYLQRHSLKRWLLNEHISLNIS